MELWLPAMLIWSIPARLFGQRCWDSFVAPAASSPELSLSVIRLAPSWLGCSCLWLEGVRGTCHLCVWPQVPLVFQPTADLGGRLTEQTLAGKELMVCAVTTSCLLRRASVQQCSGSSLKLDELINKPDESGMAASSIIPVSFNRRPCPTSAAGAQVS